MQSGGTNEEIDVDLRLSVIKPLHATWLINLYNHLTSREGKRHIAKGWEKARLHCISDQRENPSSVMKIVLNTTIERLRFTFTPNGKREFVPRDQVFSLIVVYCLLLLLKKK